MVAKRHYWRIGCGLGLLWLVWLSYGFGSPVHWSSPVRGQVIDEETGRPLEGVVVTAVWWLGGFSGSYELIAYSTEAVTDRNGKFKLHGLPIMIRRPLTWFKSLDPLIHFYKPGHDIQQLDNTPLGTYGYAGPFDTASPKRRCYWDGKVIPLARAATPEIQAGALDSARSFAFDHHLKPDRFPNLWKALVRGYALLPPAARSPNYGNPQEHIDYWEKESSR